jgi:hypothetical protein
MVSCKIVNALYDVVPSRLLRDYLIRAHLEKCEGCQARLVSRNEALLVKLGNVSLAGSLWEKIECRIGQEAAAPEKRLAGFRREWALGAITFLVFATASFWLLHSVQIRAVRADYTWPAGRFGINYINVGGAPAQAFIYKPEGARMIIVWAEKNS